MIEVIADITGRKIKFSIKDLVTFTEEILNGKLHFCTVFLNGLQCEGNIKHSSNY